MGINKPILLAGNGPLRATTPIARKQAIFPTVHYTGDLILSRSNHLASTATGSETAFLAVETGRTPPGFAFCSHSAAGNRNRHNLTHGCFFGASEV
jgi:hypothetical protein